MKLADLNLARKHRVRQIIAGCRDEKYARVGTMERNNVDFRNARPMLWKSVVIRTVKATTDIVEWFSPPARYSRIDFRLTRRDPENLLV